MHQHQPVYKTGALLRRATSASSTSARSRTPCGSFGGCLLSQEHTRVGLPASVLSQVVLQFACRSAFCPCDAESGTKVRERPPHRFPTGESRFIVVYGSTPSVVFPRLGSLTSQTSHRID